MKNFGRLFALLALMAACSSNDDPSQQGTSKVVLDFSTDLTYGKQSKAGETRSVDLTPYQNVNNYTVQLIKDGSVIKENTYGSMALEEEIDPGTYTFKAFYGDNAVAAGWDALYVEGSQTFAAQSGRTATVQFTCVPANAKMKVVYSDDFSLYYSDCTIGVTTTYQTTPFVITKADAEAGKEAYFKVDAGENTFSLTFDLKDKQGLSVTPADFGVQTVKVSPRDFLTLTVKPNIISIEGGKINGIQVSVDNGLTEEPVSVVIPDEYVQE